MTKRSTGYDTSLAKVVAQCFANIPIAIGMVKIATFANLQTFIVHAAATV